MLRVRRMFRSRAVTSVERGWHPRVPQRTRSWSSGRGPAQPGRRPRGPPKKNRPLLIVLNVNPLDRSDKKDEDEKDNVGALSSDSEAPGKHRIGTPVRDLIHKVLGLDDDNGNNEGDQVAPEDKE